MRTIIQAAAYATAIIIGMLVLAPANAKPSAPTCEDIEAAARVLMNWRQEGRMLKATVEMMGSSEIAMEIAMGAYDVPLYADQDAKRVAADEYANGVYLRCLKQA